MKTCEQVAADVLARRDAYLDRREKKIRAAKRYALAGSAVCAAAIAAAGLFRSGWFGHSPYLRLPDHSVTAGVSADFEPSGHVAGTSAPEKPGAQTQESTATPATESTTRKEMNGNAASVGGASAEKPEPTANEEVPATRREPETTKARVPETTAKQPSVPAEEPPGRKNLTAYQNDPTVPHKPSTGHSAGGKNEPVTNGNPAAEPAEPTTHANPAAEPPTQTPKDTAAPEETLYLAYVVYDGAVYAVENVAPEAIPAGARTLAQKDAVVVRYDGAESYLAAQHGDGDFVMIADAEIAAALFSADISASAGHSAGEPDTEPSSGPAAEPPSDRNEEWELPGVEQTQITLLALPGDAADARIGVTLAGTDRMLALAYVGTEEALFPTEEAG